MKRKMSLGLVFAIILVLAAMTAVAIELLTGQQIVEQIAVPMAQENDTEAHIKESFTHEELVQLLRTLNENGITLDEDSRIMQALNNGQGYYEEEVLMAICREVFGGNFSTWSVEGKHWFDNMTVKIGFKEKNPYLIPGEGDMSVPEAGAYARSMLKAEYGIDLPVEDNEQWLVWEWFYAPWTDEDGFHPALWKFEYVDPDSREVVYAARFNRDGGNVQLKYTPIE